MYKREIERTLGYINRLRNIISGLSYLSDVLPYLSDILPGDKNDTHSCPISNSISYELPKIFKITQHNSFTAIHCYDHVLAQTLYNKLISDKVFRQYYISIKPTIHLSADADLVNNYPEYVSIGRLPLYVKKFLDSFDYNKLPQYDINPIDGDEDTY